MLLVLLFENVALDVGLLVPDFDVHRARAPCWLACLSSLWVLRASVILRGAETPTWLLLGGFGGTVRTAQMREQLELGLVADHGLGAFDLDTRGFELHQQPIHWTFRTSANCATVTSDINLLMPQARPASNQISRAFMMSLPASSDVSPSMSNKSSTAWSARSSRVRTPPARQGQRQVRLHAFEQQPGRRPACRIRAFPSLAIALREQHVAGAVAQFLHHLVVELLDAGELGLR